jgi:hypothetical protein
MSVENRRGEVIKDRTRARGISERKKIAKMEETNGRQSSQDFSNFISLIFSFFLQRN